MTDGAATHPADADALGPRDALLALLRDLAWRKGRVTLASGAISDFYVDCRQVALHSQGAYLIGEQLLDALESLEHDCGRRAEAIGGMALGAIPLACSVSYAARLRGRDLPVLIVRKAAKGHGTAGSIEGLANVEQGAGLLLVEDVVTSGGSTATAAERLRAAGFDPFGCACIVDRQAGGMDRLRDAGLAVRALFTRAAIEAA